MIPAGESDRHYDVAICGAGVAGLTLAAILGQSGLRVLLVEKQRGFRMVHKGELIQPRSLEILDKAGLLDALLAAGARPVIGLSCQTPSGSELVSLDYRLLNAAYRHGLVMTYQDMLRALARQLSSSVTVWRGCGATGLLRDDSGHVTGMTIRREGGTAEITASLTVAADGLRSRLRNAAGIRVRIHQYPHQLAGFEIDEIGEECLPGSEMNAYLTDHGLRAFFALPGNKARLYAQIPLGAFRGERKRLPVFADWVVGTTPALGDAAAPLYRCLGTVQVLSAYRFVAPRWTIPGFILIGDAAHAVHPMVGQGMNAAIGDAWDLAAVVIGEGLMRRSALDSALVRYEQGRRAQLEHIASLSHDVATLLTSTSWLARKFRAVLLRRNRDNDRVRRHLTESVAGLASRPLSVRDWVSLAGWPGAGTSHVPTDRNWLGRHR